MTTRVRLIPAGALAALACLGVLLSPVRGYAQAGGTTLALAPLETLGTESKVSKKTTALVARALASLPEHRLVADRTVRRALRKTPRLRACAGDATCLAELGAKVSADYVVFGEVGGLGSAEVVYLELIASSGGKVVRTTTLELGGADNDKAARAAAYQLLIPEQFKGRLASNVDTDGASIYVDGQRLARSPAKPIALSVGSHAVRVTHPEFRDYVRFVEIEFDSTTTIDVSLQQFPIVASDMAQDPNKATSTDPRANILYRGQQPTPWYRKWYSVAGAGTVVLIGSAILVGVLSNGIDADDEKVIENPR